jgi:hypothetical protein
VEFDDQEILLWGWLVKGGIAFENTLISQAKIDDLGLNCCIEVKIRGLKSSARNIVSLPWQWNNKMKRFGLQGRGPLAAYSREVVLQSFLA